MNRPLGWMTALTCMVALWGTMRIDAQTAGTGAIQGTVEDSDGN